VGVPFVVPLFEDSIQVCVVNSDGVEHQNGDNPGFAAPAQQMSVSPVCHSTDCMRAADAQQSDLLGGVSASSPSFDANPTGVYTHA